MLCPTCSSTLRPIEYEGQDFHSCDSCGGEFIGPGELRAVVSCRHEQFDDALRSEMSRRTPAYGLPAGERDRQLACPGCGEEMRAINYGGDSGVYLDRCESCAGLWLERGELEKAQALMEEWQDKAPEALRGLAGQLREAQRAAVERTEGAFQGSRFGFINAVINRLLDAA